MDFNYRLKEYSMRDALTWGNCRGHFKKASEGTWSKDGMHKFKHGLIGAVESLPIISQIASLFEYLIVTKLEKKSAPLPGRVISQSEAPSKISGMFPQQPSSSTAIPDASIKFNTEKVLQLKDLSSISLDSVNYEGSLEVEKNAIAALISNPHLTPLLDYIQRTRQLDEKDVRGIQALYVILGIKPACVVEYVMSEELLSILNTLLPLIGKEGQYHLSMSDKHHYLVNEFPLEAFDPRRYLNRLHPQEDTNSLLTAVQYCFPNQNKPHTDQILSYLLGFGPSWEAYATRSAYLQSDLPEPLFTERHYREIGSVLKDNLSEILQEPLQEDVNAVGLGRAYHQQLPTLRMPKKANMRKQEMEQQRRFEIKGIESCTDGIVVRTDYFKKMHTLTQWVVDTFLNTN